MMKISLAFFGTSNPEVNEKITLELDNKNGIEQTILDLEARSGEIIYDPSRITSSEILDIFSKNGIEAQVVTNAD